MELMREREKVMKEQEIFYSNGREPRIGTNGGGFAG
jgi:hypothetical protein